MNKRNKFYYDEAFHTRVLTKGYIEDEGNCDSYVGVAVGWNVSNDKMIVQQYQAFEEKYKKFYMVEELKSDIIKKKFYRYGLASFRKEQIELYNEYFSLIENDIYIYISVLSKIEVLIGQIIAPAYGYGTRFGQALIYSLTKSLLVYRPNKVMNSLFNKSENFIEDLDSFLMENIREVEKLTHKEKELEVYKYVVSILDNDLAKEFDYQWYYNMSFCGLMKLIDSMDMNKNRLNLFIDNEGEENKDSRTLLAAKTEGFVQAKEVDSKDELGVRVADFLCGFVGRFVRAIEEEMRYKDNEHLHKKLFDLRWFELKEEQFKLYKKIAQILFELNGQYYMSYSGIYNDYLCLFFGMFRYFDDYATYDEYIKIEKEEHAERYNIYMCMRLEQEYQRFGTIDEAKW